MADSSTESWPGKPLWDSGIRAPSGSPGGGCDFPGLGPHSFRRANITWRQQVGGSAIEASKITGHSGLEMTGEYTFVTAERQNELTRRIQEKLSEALTKIEENAAGRAPSTPSTPNTPQSLETTAPATTVLQ